MNPIGQQNQVVTRFRIPQSIQFGIISATTSMFGIAFSISMYYLSSKSSREPYLAALFGFTGACAVSFVATCICIYRAEEIDYQFEVQVNR